MTEMTPLLWKALDDKGDKLFRDAARQKYVVGDQIDSLWHPVYVHECYLMNKEAGILKSD